MLDANLLFHNAATITTTGTSGTAGTIGIFKTPAEGVDVEIAITSIAGSTTGRTLDFKVQETDNADGSSATDLVTFPQMTGTGRRARRVQSQKPYLVLARTCGTGTGLSAVVTAGISSGMPSDEAV
jgi:hypothetical protein